jgi:hypothetical protein
MGDQMTGGGGSVEWMLDVPEVEWTYSSPKADARGHRQGGVDKGAQVGSWFTISIEAPRKMSPEEYLKALKADTGDLRLQVDAENNRVFFNLRVEAYNSDQIRVSWGNSFHQRAKAVSRPSRA